MTTFVSNFFSINGAIDTSKSVLDNLNDIATAAGAFLTYDVAEGKWAVVINTTGSSVATFTDSNIIGNIDISGTGLTELYNSATIQFPNKDLRGATDYVDVKIDDTELYTNEIENRLNFTIPLINDSAQAQYIATTELKQSRIDKIINFRTDYSYLGLKAGDLIDITNTVYGYTNKVFRIVKVEEDDSENLTLSISALEYDATIYSTAGLTIANRTKRTKIPPRNTNTEMTKADDVDVSSQINRLALANIALGLLNPKASGLIGSVIKMLTGQTKDQIVNANGDPVLSAEAEAADKVLGGAKAPLLATISEGGTMCEGGSKTITVTHACSSCLFDIPPIKYNYAITGVTSGDISIPLTGTVLVTDGTGSLTFIALADGAAEGNETATVTIGNLNTTVKIYDAYDYTYDVTKDAANITEGGTVTVTVTATGSKATASVPYAITGSGTGRVSTPLTGNIAISGGTGTLAIATTDDSTFTGTQGITFTIEPALVDPCGTVTAGGKTRTASISILDNDSATTTCSYISVPVVWCGVFNGTDDQMSGVTIRKSALFPVALAGEPTMQLPLTLTVTKGNPSTIAVATYATVAQSIAPMAGQKYDVITTFNTVVPKGLITGTVTSVVGYDA